MIRKCLPFFIVIYFSAFNVSPAWAGYIRYQEPEYMTFDELVKFVEDPHPGGALEAKLERFWKTPIISNEAWMSGERPRKIINEKLGSVLRIASWNIEKSFKIKQVIDAMTNPESYKEMIDPEEAAPGSEKYEKMLRERARLVQADILVLQEMDIGHSRSDYHNAAAELAKALKMNYVYGAEQLEIDPVYLGLEDLQIETQSGPNDSTKDFAADPARYKGVFGSAVLSKYPIKHAEVFQLQNQPYDWYYGEKPKTAFLENTRRIGTQALFKNSISRELKIGGRIYFRVDLDVPDLPEKTLTIINIHLEIKCQPKGRELQMAEILSYIKDISNPVIVMGDFNSASHDISPTSTMRVVKRTAQDPNTWVNGAITFLTPYGPVNIFRSASNLTKNLQNPMARHIPILAPNAVKGMFQTIEDYRFSDGHAFDFRGNQNRSVGGKTQKLANSNQRDFKGFKTSFQVKRPIGAIIGKLRLDWLFVKSYLNNPDDDSGPYKFAPHYGETLEGFNVFLKEALSDHHPNVADLPFEEPKL